MLDGKSCRRQWKVEQLATADALELTLNGLSRAGWDVFAVYPHQDPASPHRPPTFTLVVSRAMAATGYAPPT